MSSLLQCMPALVRPMAGLTLRTSSTTHQGDKYHGFVLHLYVAVQRSLLSRGHLQSNADKGYTRVTPILIPTHTYATYKNVISMRMLLYGGQSTRSAHLSHA